MLATITQSGFLSICAETELEGYALRRWVDENLKPDHIVKPIPIVIQPMVVLKKREEVEEDDDD